MADDKIFFNISNLVKLFLSLLLLAGFYEGMGYVDTYFSGNKDGRYVLDLGVFAGIALGVFFVLYKIYRFLGAYAPSPEQFAKRAFATYFALWFAIGSIAAIGALAVATLVVFGQDGCIAIALQERSQAHACPPADGLSVPAISALMAYVATAAYLINWSRSSPNAATSSFKL